MAWDEARRKRQGEKGDVRVDGSDEIERGEGR
jgi:hypothetical protein